MNERAAQIIEGTFTVLILAWILTHAGEFSQITTSVAGAYTGAVGALMPSRALSPNP